MEEDERREARRRKADEELRRATQETRRRYTAPTEAERKADEERLRKALERRLKVERREREEARARMREQRPDTFKRHLVFALADLSEELQEIALLTSERRERYVALQPQVTELVESFAALAAQEGGAP